jgi:iron complex transport system substrate-binding protein
LSAGIRSLAAGVGIVLLFHACAAHAQPTPARIVSLAPSVTEVLFELGLGPRVAGVTSYCRYPAAARALPKVGGYLTPSYEALVALRPDLAVVLPEHADIEPRLAALRIPVLRLDHRTVDGIVRGIALLGDRCGVQGAASALVHELRQRLAHVRDETSRAPRPRVLLCFGRTEDFRRVYGSAPGTIYDDLVSYAGGLNALPAGGASYPTLSLEAVMRLDPDVIVEFAPGRQDPEALVREWDVLGSLRAVKTGRVHVFTGDFLSVPGPRLVRFVESLARAIHPERGPRS